MQARISRNGAVPRVPQTQALATLLADPTRALPGGSSGNEAVLSLRPAGDANAEFEAKTSWRLGVPATALDERQRAMSADLERAFEEGRAWLLGSRRIGDNEGLMMFETSSRERPGTDDTTSAPTGGPPPETTYRAVLHIVEGCLGNLKAESERGEQLLVRFHHAVQTPSGPTPPAAAERHASSPLRMLPPEIQQMILCHVLEGEGQKALQGIALASRSDHAMVRPFLTTRLIEDAGAANSAASFTATGGQIRELHIKVANVPTSSLLRRWNRMPKQDQEAVVPVVASLLTWLDETVKAPLSSRKLQEDPLQTAASALDRLQKPAVDQGFDVVAPIVVRRQRPMPHGDKSIRESLLCTSIRNLSAANRPKKFEQALQDLLPNNARESNGLIQKLANILPSMPRTQQATMSRKLFDKAWELNKHDDLEALHAMLVCVPMKRIHQDARAAVLRQMVDLGTRFSGRIRPNAAHGLKHVFHRHLSLLTPQEQEAASAWMPPR